MYIHLHKMVMSTLAFYWWGWCSSFVWVTLINDRRWFESFWGLPGWGMTKIKRVATGRDEKHGCYRVGVRKDAMFDYRKMLQELNVVAVLPQMQGDMGPSGDPLRVNGRSIWFAWWERGWHRKLLCLRQDEVRLKLSIRSPIPSWNGWKVLTDPPGDPPYPIGCMDQNPAGIVCTPTIEDWLVYSRIPFGGFVSLSWK